jgi:two-component system LytT family response regulator
MDRITACIVDDEPLARTRIKTLLEDDAEIEVVAVCANGIEAVDSIKKLQPELLFLDIQMPKVDGFDVLQQLNASQIPVIIFVTAYDEFAVKAFEVHAIDYLLKPFDKRRFDLALERAKKSIKSDKSETMSNNIESLIDTMDRSSSYVSRVIVKQSGRVLFIDVKDIDWIEAAGNYVEIHSRDKSYLIRETMNNMDQKLDPDQFSRIHRSTIVNIDRVQELQSWFHGDYQVLLESGTKLTMSRNYRDLLDRYG